MLADGRQQQKADESDFSRDRGTVALPHLRSASEITSLPLSSHFLVSFRDWMQSGSFLILSGYCEVLLRHLGDIPEY